MGFHIKGSRRFRWPCDLRLADIVGLNTAEDKKCWPLRRADHSLRGVLPAVRLIVCDLETSTMKQLRLYWPCWPTEKKLAIIMLFFKQYFVTLSLSVQWLATSWEIEGELLYWRYSYFRIMDGGNLKMQICPCTGVERLWSWSSQDFQTVSTWRWQGCQP